jgi:hypothetical protein
MNLTDALQKVSQILDEERINPTGSYEVSKAFLESLGSLAPLVDLLNDQSSKRPAEVRPNPEEYQFKSVNFDLLCALFEQAPEQDRAAMFASINARILDAKSYRHKYRDVVNAGSRTNCSSELPLVAEFLVRRGDKQLFVSALFEAAISPGLTLLLSQLEVMIALNLTLFTDEEYAQIPPAMAQLHSAVEKIKQQPAPAGTIASNTRFHVTREVPELCDSIVEKCRKARYLYTKGSLLPGMNLEVNQDKGKVQTFLEK